MVINKIRNVDSTEVPVLNWFLEEGNHDLRVLVEAPDGATWFVFRIFPDGTYETCSALSKNLGLQLDKKNAIKSRTE